jgi:cyclopropane fatty-acyl-phospholipid synthase-like methyltransferase
VTVLDSAVRYRATLQKWRKEAAARAYKAKKRGDKAAERYWRGKMNGLGEGVAWMTNIVYELGGKIP